MEVQIFGSKKNADVRKALRFFAERRIRTHFVDFAERGPSPGELKRFGQKFGLRSLIDRDSKRFADLGLAHAMLSEDRWIEKLCDEPLVLVQPLIRCQNQLALGLAEDQWKAWVDSQA